MYAIDAQTGKLVWETQVLDPKARVDASSGPIIANGKVITGRQCQPGATNDACIITAHDAKTGKELWRTRTIPRPGEPGDETWGDVPLERALARRHLDGAELRPGDEPDLRRHVGDDSGAEVHARRQRQAAPVSQLHARAERRHRQDRLVLPARRRSLGPRSSVRAAAGGHGRRAGPEGSAVDQPAASSRASGARSSPAFPARPASSTRSIARPASSCGRGRR